MDSARSDALFETQRHGGTEREEEGKGRVGVGVQLWRGILIPRARPIENYWWVGAYPHAAWRAGTPPHDKATLR